MSDDELRSAILKFFEERGKLIPADDTDLLDSGIIDSMDLVELVAHLEAVGVEVAHDAMTVDNFRSLGAILATCGKGSQG